MRPFLWGAALLTLAGIPGGLAAQTVMSATEGNDLDRMDLQSLLDVKVITASKFSEKASDAPGVVSVVTQDELRKFGGVTLREILERVAGLSATSSYFTDRSMIAVRGDQSKINGGHVLFLINGRPTREVLEGGLVSDLLESFPVAALERIEVIKGPGSVLYGSNAFSGVVNLITKEATGTETTVKGFGGEQGAKGATGVATLRRGDLRVTAAAQVHQQADWSTTYRLPEAFVQDPAAPLVPAEQQLLIRNQGPGAYLGVNYKGLSVMSSYTEWQTPAFVRGTVGQTRWRRGFADLGYGLKPRRNWDMTFNLTYTRNTLKAYAYPDIARDSDESLLEWTNALRLSTRDHLTFGMLYDYIRGHENYLGLGFPLTISRGTRPSGAVYAQWDHQLWDTVKLVGGFQVNKIAGVSLNAVPRGGVVWTLTPRVTVKALYSRAFRAPSLNETHLDHPGLLGNPNLQPEKVGTWDIGIGYQGRRIQGSMNFFHSHQTDSIVVVPAVDRWHYDNLGSATFQGVEMDGKYYLRQHWFLMSSLSYQVNRQGGGTTNSTPVPNLTAKAGLSYETPGGMLASVFDNYQGPPHGFQTVGVNPPVAAHHLISAQLRFDLSRYLAPNSKTGLALFVYGENLANRQVWMPDWGDNPSDTIPVQRGRTVYFGLEFRRKAD